MNEKLCCTSLFTMCCRLFMFVFHSCGWFNWFKSHWHRAQETRRQYKQTEPPVDQLKKKQCPIDPMQKALLFSGSAHNTQNSLKKRDFWLVVLIPLCMYVYNDTLLFIMLVQPDCSLTHAVFDNGVLLYYLSTHKVYKYIHTYTCFTGPFTVLSSLILYTYS